MDRLSFIRKAIVGAGITTLPLGWFKQYRKFYLLQCFVRGFRYYSGPSIISQMKIGDMLELVREPSNEYDPNAIALHYNKQKIGFLPAEENTLLSRLLDLQVLDLQAEITHLEPDAATWENVSVALFVLKEKPLELSDEQIASYTSLETPEYYSLKGDNNTVTRLSLKKDYDDYYTFLVEHYPDDGIYSMIHEHLIGNVEYGYKDRVFVIDKAVLKVEDALDEIVSSAQDWVDKLDIHFTQENLLPLSMKHAEKIIPNIKELIPVASTQGNQFIQLVV